MTQIVKVSRKVFEAWELAMTNCPVYFPDTTKVEIMNCYFTDRELLEQGVEHILVKGFALTPED